MKKVSIIIPVYNASKYLDKCISSIVNQTYIDLEIILIDDGSIDNSLEICKLWECKDNRIIVCSQKNSGQASARNRGLDIATGNYISFVDSDDFIDYTMIEKMLNRIICDGSDICCCGMNLVYIDGKIVTIKRKQDIIKSKDAFREALSIRGSNIGFEVWNKLFRAELFKNIRFAEGMLYEDAEINLRILTNDYIISVMEEPFYNYFQSDNSTMRKKFDFKDFDRLKVWEKALEISYDKYPEYIDMAKIRKLRCELYLLFKSLASGIRISQKQLYKIRDDISKSYFIDIIKLKGIKEKCFFLCLKINYNKTCLFLEGKSK